MHVSQIFQEPATEDIGREREREKDEGKSKEKGRIDKLAKDLKLTYSKLERKTMEVHVHTVYIPSHQCVMKLPLSQVEKLKKEVDFLRHAGIFAHTVHTIMWASRCPLIT